MDRLSAPSYQENTGCLTIEMLNEGFKALWDGHERTEERRRNYYAALNPLLKKLDPNDLEGMLALVKLVSSGFYEPLHPDDAKWCFNAVRDRGITEFD